MRKLFLILMMCLLPYQFAWSMVASYDTHGVKDTGVHFGHHAHELDAVEIDLTALDLAQADITQLDLAQADLVQLSDTLNADQNDSDTPSSENHVHYGLFHMSCGELTYQTLPVFESIGSHFSSQYLFSYHAPVSNALDRPNWSAPVPFGELSHTI